MDVIKSLKQKDKQINDKIGKLLNQKDKLSLAIMYHLVNQQPQFDKQVTNQSLQKSNYQPIHNHYQNHSKHNPIDYNKLSKSNPINISHQLSNHHKSNKSESRSKYNHLYYLKHRQHILKRTKIRRAKKSHQGTKNNQPKVTDGSHKVTQSTHKRNNNIIFKSNLDKTNKVNWRDQNDPF